MPVRKRAKRIKKVEVVKLEERPEDWPLLEATIRAEDVPDIEVEPDSDIVVFEAVWYVIDNNNPEVLYYGPYKTKAEATEAKKDIQQFWKWENE